MSETITHEPIGMQLHRLFVITRAPSRKKSGNTFAWLVVVIVFALAAIIFQKGRTPHTSVAPSAPSFKHAEAVRHSE